MKIHLFEELASTNDEARDPRYGHGEVILAERQTAGRGQRGHTWSSTAGENLTGSVVWEPRFLPVGEQFILSQCVALALCDLMADYGIEARIKWTNDLYIGDRKVAGILIEHTLGGAHLARTIIGIGLNVNQLAFDPELPNPDSMRRILGRPLDRREVLERLCRRLAGRYAQLERGEWELLRAEYLRRMYRLGEEHLWRHPDGRIERATLRGVQPTGELLLEGPDGRITGYLFRQIEFVIAGRDDRS